MGLDIAGTAIVAFFISALLTHAVRKFALSRGLLDVPNARSSHSAVTPRGGGLAMVVATSCASVWLLREGRIPLNLFMAVLGGGSVVAAIGFLDDRRPVSARARLAVHIAAAVWALAWIGPPVTLTFGVHVIHLGWAGAVLAVFAIVWALNLFNFMDGIDGIAASEAIFISFGSAAVLLVLGGSNGVMVLALVLGASCAGFLLWNWPPAKIFMGDVGSGYLGYVIGVLVLAAAREDAVAVWIWVILGGLFFVDATVTLVRRVLRGDRVYEAHRSHAYQWLARRWQSHKKVTLFFMVLNVVWLLPFACFAALNPKLAVWGVFVALTPLVALTLVAGAGQRETA